MKNDGGPVFPQPERSPDPDAPEDESGLSLRDYFAAKALAGMLSNNSAFDSPHRAATWAYEFADAMVAARAEGR